MLMHEEYPYFPSLRPPPFLTCDPTPLIWREGIPFEVLTRRTAFVDGLLDEVV